MIPEEMRGGWVRITMTVADGEPFEDNVVWWLQAGAHHADLRVPLAEGRPMSFAGVTSWDGTRLTWSPDLELDPSVFEDVGVITWDGADLMEAGTFDEDGATVGYVERWRRLPGTETPLVALSRDGARIVRTGDLALTLVDDRPAGGAFTAVAWRLVDGAWVEDHRLASSDAVVATPPLEVSGDRVALDDGHVWSVQEHLS